MPTLESFLKFNYQKVDIPLAIIIFDHEEGDGINFSKEIKQLNWGETLKPFKIDINNKDDVKTAIEELFELAIKFKKGKD